MGEGDGAKRNKGITLCTDNFTLRAKGERLYY